MIGARPGSLKSPSDTGQRDDGCDPDCDAEDSEQAAPGSAQHVFQSYREKGHAFLPYNPLRRRNMLSVALFQCVSKMPLHPAAEFTPRALSMTKALLTQGRPSGSGETEIVSRVSYAGARHGAVVQEPLLDDWPGFVGRRR